MKFFRSLRLVVVLSLAMPSVLQASSLVGENAIELYGGPRIGLQGGSFGASYYHNVVDQILDLGIVYDLEISRTVVQYLGNPDSLPEEYYKLVGLKKDSFLGVGFRPFWQVGQHWSLYLEARYGFLMRRNSGKWHRDVDDDDVFDIDSSPLARRGGVMTRSLFSGALGAYFRLRNFYSNFGAEFSVIAPYTGQTDKFSRYRPIQLPFESGYIHDSGFSIAVFTEIIPGIFLSDTTVGLRLHWLFGSDAQNN